MKAFPKRYLPLIIFVFALVLRLAYMFFLRQHYFFYNNPSADVTYYLDWAREIALVDPVGHKTFFGLPLYPYVLAVFYRLSLGHLEVIRIFQILLGSLNCVLLFFLSKRIFQSTRIAFVAGILMATHFLMIYYDFLMMPVTLIITLTLIILLALTQRETFTHWRQWFILGILIGLTVLGDGKFLFFLMGISLLLFLEKKSLTKKIIPVMLIWLGATAMIGGCALRNRIVGGDWVMISAQSGLSFYAGNNEGATGTFSNPEYIRPTHEGQDEDQKIIAESIAGHTLSPKEVSAFWKNKALTFITQHPLAYLKLLMHKTRLFFTDTQYGSDLDLILQWPWKNCLDIQPLPFLFIFGIFGMLISVRRYPDARFAMSAVVAQWIMTMLFFMSSRHRATIVPLMLMFESAMLFFIPDYLRKKNVWKSALILIISLGSILFFPTEYLPQQDIAFIRYAKSGPIYEEHGDFSMAHTMYRKALNIRPQDTNTIYNQGTVFFKQGDMVTAEKYFQRVMRICPYHVDAIFNLATVYAETGRRKQAVSLFQKVLTFQPDSLDVHFQLAKIYSEIGECQSALKHADILTHQVPALKPKIQAFLTNCLP